MRAVARATVVSSSDAGINDNDSKDLAIGARGADAVGPGVSEVFGRAPHSFDDVRWRLRGRFVQRANEAGPHCLRRPYQLARQGLCNRGQVRRSLLCLF